MFFLPPSYDIFSYPSFKNFFVKLNGIHTSAGQGIHFRIGRVSDIRIVLNLRDEEISILGTHRYTRLLSRNLVPRVVIPVDRGVEIF